MNTLKKVWDMHVIKDPQDSWNIDERQIMPDYYRENGLIHAVVYGGDLYPDKLNLQKFGGHWLVVKERIPF